MTKYAYAAVMADGTATQRLQERQVFLESIALLKAAENSGPGSEPARAALEHVNKLWCYLIADLSQPGNDLPENLKRGLLELGIRALHEAGRISRAESENFGLLRQISENMAAGLA